MTVLTASLVLFVAAALAGAVLVRMHATRARPPHVLVVGHSLIAGSALLLLAGAYVRNDGPNSLAIALVVLVLAAAGGIGLSTLRVKKGRVPRPLIALHALVALAGTGLVAYELVDGRPSVPEALPAEDETASMHVGVQSARPTRQGTSRERREGFRSAAGLVDCSIYTSRARRPGDRPSRSYGTALAAGGVMT